MVVIQPKSSEIIMKGLLRQASEVDTVTKSPGRAENIGRIIELNPGRNPGRGPARR